MTSQSHLASSTHEARPALFALLIALSLWASFDAQAQPKLSIQKAEIDLGTIYNGALIRTPITISNAGTADLIITSVRTSCGCTTVKQPAEPLKPGASATIEVEFNSAGFRGRAVKYVYIQTNDTSADYHTITLRVDIKEELVPVPPVSVIWLGNVALGKAQSKAMTFVNASPAKLSLKKISGLPSSVKATIRPKTVAPSDTLEVLLTITPDHEGYVNAEVFLETSSTRQPRVPFRITYIGVKPE